MRSMAAAASESSTFLERRAFAWAVDRRMSVSSVRAVTGWVCGGGGGVCVCGGDTEFSRQC